MKFYFSKDESEAIMSSVTERIELPLRQRREKY